MNTEEILYESGKATTKMIFEFIFDMLKGQSSQVFTKKEVINMMERYQKIVTGNLENRKP